MTAKQRFFYLDLARRAHAASAPLLPFDVWRHEEVARALGQAKRFREFTNTDLDRVLHHFQAILDPHTSILDAEEGDRRRLLFVIRQLRGSLPARYAHAILRDRFKVFFDEQLDTLDLRTLKQLRYTLQARAQALSRRSGGGQSAPKTGGEHLHQASPAPRMLAASEPKQNPVANGEHPFAEVRLLCCVKSKTAK